MITRTLAWDRVVIVTTICTIVHALEFNIYEQNNKQIDDITMYSNMQINKNKEKQKESPVETVLVLQGGGSLGAYECGVYKTLAKYNVRFDIVSGTSIGALNAAIIASHSYDGVLLHPCHHNFHHYILQMSLGLF
jgi:hypothetical protein